MEFGFSEQELAFREAVEDFLKKELPHDWPEKSTHWPGGYGTLELQDPKMLEVVYDFRRKLVDKGWLTISWPKEYGGEAHSYIEQALFEERMSYFNLIDRTVSLMTNHMAQMSMKNFPPDVMIEISRDACGTFDFFKAGEMLEMGRAATVHALDKLESA